jgi:hypothetical protein
LTIAKLVGYNASLGSRRLCLLRLVAITNEVRFPQRPPMFNVFAGAAVVALVLLVPCLGLANTDDQASAPVDSTAISDESPQAVKLSEHLYQIGNIVMDTQQRCLYVPARVNMSKGLVELLVCGEMGKKHESVLVAEAAPEHIQVGLLVLGLEPGGGLEYQGDPRAPKGDSVWIWVEWEKEGEHKRLRAEELVLNYATEKPMQNTHWVFAGSEIVDGRFAASIEQSIVTTYHDPYTIIDNPLPTGGDDTLYGANEGVVPEVGDPMVLILKADHDEPISFHAMSAELDLNLGRRPDDQTLKE